MSLDWNWKYFSELKKKNGEMAHAHIIEKPNMVKIEILHNILYILA